jgi:periplasmic protein CpxP/Spy
MSSFAFPIAISARLTRSVAVAALLGATMLASPLSTARAAPPASTPMPSAQTAAPASPPAASAATSTPATKGETVEERITSLHTALQITPNEEANWTGVAKAMRDNAATMQKLASDKADQDTQGMTAVDDLKVYEKFARAHVAGLKSLTVSFDKLYSGMPDAQKKVADGVFQNFGHQSGTAAHS